MSWSTIYQFGETLFEIDSGSPSLYWLADRGDPRRKLEGARLCLTVEAIAEMSGTEVISLARWFQKYAEEFAIIHTANEANFNSSIISDEDLEIIIHSDFASEKIKRAAKTEYRLRRLGSPQPKTKVEHKLVTLRQRQVKQAGYIYLARSETGPYKIGRSKGPKRRIRVFKTIMPVEVDFIHMFGADDMVTAEIELHVKYDEFRFKGEWFNLEDSQVEWIKSVTGYTNGRFQHEGQELPQSS